MRKILPEEEHVIKFNNHYHSGKAFYDAVRYLRDNWQMFVMGLDRPSPTDKLVMQIAMTEWSGGGTATTWPKDVSDWINSMHEMQRNTAEETKDVL
jgi:hypothetical protein